VRSRRRFCTTRRLLVTLSVIGIALAQSVTLRSASAQSFVACERQQTKVGAQDGVDIRWRRAAEEILHAFAGDDLHAYFGFHPRIQLVEKTVPNAFALAPGAIVLSSGLIDITASTSELAFVLAHELGHLILGRGDELHTLAAVRTGHDDRLAEEFAADAYAVRLLKERGFDPGAGVDILNKIVESTERRGGAAETLFPSINSRIVAMRRNIAPTKSY